MDGFATTNDVGLLVHQEWHALHRRWLREANRIPQMMQNASALLHNGRLSPAALDAPIGTEHQDR